MKEIDGIVEYLWWGTIQGLHGCPMSERGRRVVSISIRDIFSEVKYLIEHTGHFDNVHDSPLRQLR